MLLHLQPDEGDPVGEVGVALMPGKSWQGLTWEAAKEQGEGLFEMPQ